MKKEELIQKLCEEYEGKYSKKKVYLMVNLILNSIKQAIASGENIKIYGFGNFRRTGKRITFKPSKRLIRRLKSGHRKS
ncbi:MAG: HU family DNA-binding protein [Aquificaceae bacterium]|nr:HU family DNA-binding protein [Aquificaceae bacterium]MCS7308075.1 HU family DNA-binding protein [Aquificaceae bacterium]